MANMAMGHKVAYNKLKNHELEVLLQVRNLHTGGSKIEMAARLIKDDAKEATEQKASAARVAAAVAAVSRGYPDRVRPDSNIGTPGGGGQGARGDSGGLKYDEDGLPNFSEERESDQSIHVNKATFTTNLPEVPAVTTGRNGKFGDRPSRKKRKVAHAGAFIPAGRTPTIQTPSSGYDGSGEHVCTNECTQTTNTNADDREQGANIGEMSAIVYTTNPAVDLWGQSTLWNWVSVLLGAILTILTVIMCDLWGLRSIFG